MEELISYFIDLYHLLFHYTKVLGEIVFFCLVWYAGAYILVKGFNQTFRL